MGEVRELYAIFHPGYEVQFGFGEATGGGKQYFIEILQLSFIKGNWQILKTSLFDLDLEV